MRQHPDDDQTQLVDRIVEEYVDASLQGQNLDLDEFLNRYPAIADKIRKRIEIVRNIDSLFDNLVCPAGKDFSQNDNDFIDGMFKASRTGRGLSLIDFDDLVLGTTYNVGDSFEISGVGITAVRFLLINNESTNKGYATVEDGCAAGGSGMELAIHDISLKFDFGVRLSGLSVQYGEYGGNINLEINGQLVNVEDFVNIPKEVGGTFVSAIDAGEHGKSSGIMTVVGTINSLTIGGQNLWVDNILPSVAPQPGAPALSEFQITRQIAKGGMGTVFLARQVSLDREVAVKVISDLNGTRLRTLDRFKREAIILAKISHPNIVQIYDVGQQGSYSYFAMEYVDGTSLDKIIASIRNAGSDEKASTVLQRCLDARDCVYPSKACEDNSAAEIDKDYIIAVSKMIIDIASALAYAHDKGILHRDIKPSNILIDSTGKAKLVDFGLAKSELQQSITITGELFGTPSYMSPEQIRRPDTVECRSDIYSLGATFYECLTLRPPFEGETVDETLTKVLSGGVAPPRKYCSRLPTDLNVVLLHALEKVPDDRYSSAIEFAQDIQNVLDFKPINAKRPSAAQRVYRTLRRNPNKVLIALVIILLIIVLYQVFFSSR